MPVPWKTGGRIQPHRERAKAAKAAAVQALNTALEPLQVDPPEWLPEQWHAAWSDFRPLLPEAVVRQSDLCYVAMTCILYEKMRRDELSAGLHNVLQTCLDKLGMSPAGRRKLATMTQTQESATGNSRFARFDPINDDA